MLPITARLGARTINAELPVRPVWVGIALDTVVYGAALWLLVRSLGALRRGIRSRRGLCPGCAYPAGVSPLCTECGTALRPWAARTPPAA
jgi:hypothetical protein